MNENVPSNSLTVYDDLMRTRSRVDPDKLKIPPILVSGRFGDADIERAKQQLAALRTDINLKRSVPNVTVLVTSLPSISTPEPKCETPTAKSFPSGRATPAVLSLQPEIVSPAIPISAKGKAPPKAPPPPMPSKAGPPSVQTSRPSIGRKAPPVPSSGPKAVAPPPPPVVPHAQRLSLGGGVPSSSSCSTTQNDFINIHWKPASSLASHSSDNNDQFLKPFVDDSAPHHATVEKLLSLDPVPPVIDPKASIFHRSTSPPPTVVVDTLKQYFQKKQNKLEIGGTGSSSMDPLNQNNGRKSALEKERLKLIALAIGGSLGIRSSGNKRGIFRQYRDAIIRCDYSILRTEILCPLLQLLNNVTVEEMTSVVDLVKESLGRNDEISILDDFEEPDVFLYEMSKIPEIKTRIECMILEQSFEDLFQITVNSLNVVYTALEVLFTRLGDITRLFQLILRVGNTLNEGSKFGGSQTSFSLSTLAKLAELKSSLDPKVDLLHYILSLIPPEESPCIFTESDLGKLKNAANLRCYRVRDEVKDLLESVGAIGDIISHPVPLASGEDVFNDRMKLFSDRISGTEKWLSIYALNVFRSYKNLSNYFEDTRSIYPPPKEKTNDQFDIIELFAWFASVLRGHEKDIKRLKLRQKIGTATTSVKVKSRRPSNSTQDALHSSIKALAGEDNAAPIAALITRQSGDLTASKPKLSPIPSPVVEVVVVPADQPRSSNGSSVAPSVPTRRLLTTKGTASIVSARSVAIPQAGLSVAGPPIPTRRNSIEGLPDTYPVRREGLPDPEVSLNTRVSLSNTISRVAMLLSPSRDDNNPGGPYMGTRKTRASLVGSLEMGS